MKQEALFDYKSEYIKAKPFLKWAGGKTQLLKELEYSLPKNIKTRKKIDKYVEPFIGGGAFFFYLKSNYEIKESVICDVNKELIIGYKVIQEKPLELINELKKLQETYLVKQEEQRKDFFYNIRTLYNEQRFDFDYNVVNDNWVKRASYLIFLNKTCFNGLFRMNKKGGFNVPFGRYKKPKICDKENILEVKRALENTKILNVDFEKTDKFIKKNTLVYFDPPYRPINKTSSFTSYSKDGFNDEDQKRLASFYKKLNAKNTNLILSNSDPKNHDPKDDFFDELYKDYQINRVKATRMINSNSSKRGKINELIIVNY